MFDPSRSNVSGSSIDNDRLCRPRRPGALAARWCRGHTLASPFRGSWNLGRHPFALRDASPGHRSLQAAQACRLSTRRKSATRRVRGLGGRDLNRIESRESQGVRGSGGQRLTAQMAGHIAHQHGDLAAINRPDFG